MPSISKYTFKFVHNHWTASILSSGALVPHEFLKLEMLVSKRYRTCVHACGMHTDAHGCVEALGGAPTVTVLTSPLPCLLLVGKSKEAEMKRINKELANIRSKFKSECVHFTLVRIS